MIYHTGLPVYDKYHQIKTLSDIKEAIRACDLAVKNQLVASSLNSKQKSEILLIAKIEAYKIIAAYLEAINQN